MPPSGLPRSQYTPSQQGCPDRAYFCSGRPGQRGYSPTAADTVEDGSAKFNIPWSAVAAYALLRCYHELCVKKGMLPGDHQHPPCFPECELFICDHRGTIVAANDAGKALIATREKPLSIHAFIPALPAFPLPCDALQLETTLSLPVRPMRVVQLLPIATTPPACALTAVVCLSPTSQFRSPLAELTSVIHDIKNPLSTVVGCTDMLLETVCGVGITEEQRGVLRRARLCALRAIELLRNVQLYTQLTLNPTRATSNAGRSCDLAVVLRDYITNEFRAPEGGPEIRSTITSTPAPIPLDRLSVERIAQNLLSNGCAYGAPGSVITVTVEVTPTTATLAVHNTGAVILASDQERIFEPYQRGPHGLSSPGLGLGLFIVRELLTRAGGSICVSSSAEAGTTFTATLPLKREPPTA